MRLFLAVNFTAAVQGAVHAAAAPLRMAAPGLPWVPAARLHLTVKFLGELDGEAVSRLAGAMDEVARRHAMIPSSIREFGAFPNFRRPRVVWIGMRDDPHLELLHHDVEVATQAMGLPAAGRPFRPHVTLARIPQGLAVEELRGLARAARATPGRPIATVVRRIDLMCSTRRSDGVLHELLHASPLRDS